MKNLILVDGNNLLFRSYYATAYSGSIMRNSDGFPTNALFGFANMMNKIIKEESPTHIIVAFDKGKTFRHDKYNDYKAGRLAMPEDLKLQFPKAKSMLENMGITYYEIDNYEADDIIGTFAKFCEEDDNFTGTIISSDKDLLQLISKTVNIKLLKSKDFIRYNVDSFKEEWGIDPINIIDLKALMGDSSDNIPGVKGIGEKTALKLLHEYKTLDGIYNNIDKISGSTKSKLENDKESAYYSYELATIYKDVPMEIKIDDLVYRGPNVEKLNEIYEELEFYSFLRKDNKVSDSTEIDYKIVDNIDDINMDKCAVFLEMDGPYHTASIKGMAVYSEDNQVFIPFEVLKNSSKFLTNVEKFTYDYKRLYVALKKQNLEVGNVSFDTMLAAYLLEYNLKEDIAYLANQFDVAILSDDDLYKKKDENDDVIIKNSIKKAKFIYDTKVKLEEKLRTEEMYDLFKNVEMPLSSVLGDMEYDGIYIDKEPLYEMKKELEEKIDVITNEIYDLAGVQFNIASPKQLGEILFERLLLPHGKKGKTGYSTSVDVLKKLANVHPIINKILDYRSYTKLYSTYIQGLIDSTKDDGKIHTIYNQALTRTGRLSSQDPNLQNIPARDDYGKLIRKAFVPSQDSVILSGDYSQIELRILAHMANVESLIDAFNNDIDIHKKTASDIFNKPVLEVTKEDRRVAKAVNFGIIYGISSFGLSENLGIRPKDAKRFIDDYLNTYPGIKKYMDDTILDAHIKGYVKTLFNRKRVIPELESKNFIIKQSGERMALNTPIQGTSADIIKIAMVEVSKKLKSNNLKSKLVLQIHDELVIDTKKDELDVVKKILTESMENVCNLRVPLKVEVSYGDNLYEAK